MVLSNSVTLHKVFNRNKGRVMGKKKMTSKYKNAHKVKAETVIVSAQN